MLASPYEPFPPELSKQADVVEIIRRGAFMKAMPCGAIDGETRNSEEST